jgi:two-component system cell cycle sensor histidine kinase PleC
MSKWYDRILRSASNLIKPRPNKPLGVVARALQEALNSIPEAFALWDSSGKMILYNRNYAEVYGLDSAGIAQLGDRTNLRQLLGKVVVNQQPSVDGQPGDFEAELKDGRWVRISERRTSEGGWVLTAFDITAAKAQKEVDRTMKMRYGVQSRVSKRARPNLPIWHINMPLKRSGLRAQTRPRASFWPI